MVRKHEQIGDYVFAAGVINMALSSSNRCNGFWYEEQITEELLLRMVFKKVRAHTCVCVCLFLSYTRAAAISISSSCSSWLPAPSTLSLNPV